MKMNNPSERFTELVELSELIKRGWSDTDIAKEMDRTPYWSFKQRQKLHKQWERRAARNVDQERTQVLKEINHATKEAFDAFKLSQGKKRSTVQKVSRDGRKSQGRTEDVVSEEESPGDPRFMELVFKGISQKKEILGLDAPTEVQIDERKNVTIGLSETMEVLQRAVENGGDSPALPELVSSRSLLPAPLRHEQNGR